MAKWIVQRKDNVITSYHPEYFRQLVKAGLLTAALSRENRETARGGHEQAVLCRDPEAFLVILDNDNDDVIVLLD